MTRALHMAACDAHHQNAHREMWQAMRVALNTVADSAWAPHDDCLGD
jgi:hypothetical protein